MNKTYHFTLLIAFFALAQVNLSAQQNKYTFGIKVGMNLADIDVRSSDLFVERDYEFALLRLWHLGVVASFDINQRFSIQSEILFSQKGGQSIYELNTLPEKAIEHKMSYLSIPLFLQYKIGPIKIQAGPEFAYLVANKVEDENGALINSPFYLTDHKFDLSTNIGFQFTVKKLFAQVRWQHGLLSIADISFTDANGEFIGEYNYYHNVLQVSLGYLFVN